MGTIANPKIAKDLSRRVTAADLIPLLSEKLETSNKIEFEKDIMEKEPYSPLAITHDGESLLTIIKYAQEGAPGCKDFLDNSDAVWISYGGEHIVDPKMPSYFRISKTAINMSPFWEKLDSFTMFSCFDLEKYELEENFAKTLPLNDEAIRKFSEERRDKTFLGTSNIFSPVPHYGGVVNYYIPIYFEWNNLFYAQKATFLRENDFSDGKNKEIANKAVDILSQLIELNQKYVHDFAMVYKKMPEYLRSSFTLMNPGKR